MYGFINKCFKNEHYCVCHWDNATSEDDQTKLCQNDM